MLFQFNQPHLKSLIVARPLCLRPRGDPRESANKNFRTFDLDRSRPILDRRERRARAGEAETRLDQERRVSKSAESSGSTSLSNYLFLRTRKYARLRPDVPLASSALREPPDNGTDC